MPAFARGELVARALLIAGAPSQAVAVGRRIALDHGGGSGENWSVMVLLVSFAAHPRSR